MKTQEIDVADLKRFVATLPEGIQSERFVWFKEAYSVPKALYLAYREHLEPISVKVQDWCAALGMACPKDETGKRIFLVNGVCDAEATASDIDPNIPLVIVEHPHGEEQKLFSLVIDGNKRLRRAYLENRDVIRAYYLTHDLAKLTKI